MHSALALDDVKGLVGVVAVHIISVAGLGIDVEPSMKPIGVENYFTLAMFSRHFRHIHYFDRHSSSRSLRSHEVISRPIFLSMRI
jgi:hypothetical protein